MGPYFTVFVYFAAKRWKMDDGRCKMDDGRCKMDDGRCKMDE